MAVVLYKDGEVLRADPMRLKQYLQGGWSLTKEPVESKPEPEVIASEAPTFEEADTNSSGKLSSQEVREAAKEAGLDGWDTKRIKTLKAELGYE